MEAEAAAVEDPALALLKVASALALLKAEVAALALRRLVGHSNFRYPTLALQRLLLNAAAGAFAAPAPALAPAPTSAPPLGSRKVRMKHEDAAEPSPRPGDNTPLKAGSLRPRTRSSTRPPLTQPPPPAPAVGGGDADAAEASTAPSSESAGSEVCITRTRTRGERDAEARRHAIDVEAIDDEPTEATV